MSSRNLTRESGSSYLVKFFEDNETLIVSRSRIFTEGRVNVGDISKVQWGNTQEQSSDGEVLEVGNYCDLSKTLKTLKTVTQTKEKPAVKKAPPPKKSPALKKTAAKRKNEESKENQPRKKLKSGVSKLFFVLIPSYKFCTLIGLSNRM